ncbi:unnamed protein product, partial [Urochloa humidicola]
PPTSLSFPLASLSSPPTSPPSPSPPSLSPLSVSGGLLPLSPRADRSGAAACGERDATQRHAMAAADVDTDALAADIICSLRGADLAGWTPPWCCKPDPAPAPREGELIWPRVARGKRSRRRSPSAAGKGGGRWGRGSPASPLDYSGGSGSGSAASTSGGEDAIAGFCSPGHQRAPAANKVGSIGRPQLTFPTPPTRTMGQRPRKKLRLPEVQQLVRSLTVENESLREEMRDLQRACKALSKENDKLETRLGQSDLPNKITSKDQKGKEQMEQIDEQWVMQSARDCFALPDLNLLPQDTTDVSTVH